MQQVWAEVLYMYKQGEPWTLKADELNDLNLINQMFEVVDEVEDMLNTAYDWTSDKSTWRKLTATEIGKELGYASYMPAKKIARFVKKINGNMGYKSGSKRFLLVPERS